MRRISGIAAAAVLAACVSGAGDGPRPGDGPVDTARYGDEPEPDGPSDPDDPPDPDEPAPEAGAEPDPDPEPEPEPAPDPDPGPAGCPGGAAAWEEVAGEVRRLVEAARAPGAALAVVCEGELVHAAGFGVTRAGGGQAVTGATRFQLASVTKMFAGAAAVALDEAGTVDLHAPVGRVLGDVAYGGATLHQLLTHTAGFPTEFAEVMSADLVTVVRDNGAQALWAPPGAVWNYSNPGYSVVGAALEIASGTPFGRLVETEVFAPAGMRSATMHVPRVLAEAAEHPYAHGHAGGPGAPEAIAPDGAYFASGIYGPQGGAWGSVEDLARWGLVHLAGGGEVLSEAGAAALRTFHTRTNDTEKGYGYGLFVETYVAPEVVSHGGATPGFNAEWRLIPELRMGVFAVSNAEWLAATDIADVAMDRYAQLRWQGAAPTPPRLADFEGSYVDPFELGNLRVTAGPAADQLTVHIGGAAQPMTHLWEDNFSFFHPVLAEEIDVVFWRQPGAAAEYIVSIWGVATRT